MQCSVLLRPPLPPRDLYLITAACALAVRSAVLPLLRTAPQLKWPNDVLLEEWKVCGILSETELTRGEAPVAVVGFGLNVHAAPDQGIVPNATSLSEHAIHPLTRLDVLCRVLREYDHLLSLLYGGGADGIWQQWRCELQTLGTQVQIRAPGGTAATGLALDVSRDGGLVLETSAGVTRTVYSGEVAEP
ncbi:MAG: biotin--[acetyl-CoA-carboxylase] ligase [Chloroflexota bacterium]|nr:biotin--[acetyl-CoA-carboxylase] ligase [Chloroflexota bacterium]